MILLLSPLNLKMKTTTRKQKTAKKKKKKKPKNLRNDKWLLNCSYNPHKNNIGNHLKALSDFLDSRSSTYEKVLCLGDFNVEVDDQILKIFCDSYSLTSLLKHPTCYKNPSNPKCIDLILTNVPRSFQTTCVIETELTDFHLITLTVVRKSFKKLKSSY